MESQIFNRELTVLKEGLCDGLKDVVSTTWGDLKQSGRSFVEHPLDTTGQYLKNHWQDAAAGAIISIVNPKGMANALLVGWSLRGLGSATYEALREAAMPANDLSAVKERLRSAVSHEGTAFMAAMPMAMLGSSVGRAGASAVFGRDLALYDMACGKVRPYEVKTNLLGIADAVHPPKIKMVITDLDQTTYGFYNYFAPAMRTVVPELAAKTGMSEEAVFKALGKVMDARRSHDWPWVLEESELARVPKYKDNPELFRTEVVEPYHKVIDDCVDRYLRPYNGVIDTLQELQRRGVKVYALSDAPAYVARVRAEKTGVANYLDGIWALKTAEPQLADVRFAEAFQSGRARIDSSFRTPSSAGSFTELPHGFEKPNTGGIEQVLSQHPELRPNKVLFIGDSRVKDGGVAQGANVRFIWARYGADLVPEYYDIMERSLRPNFADTGTTKAKKYPPIFAEAANYADLLKYLEPKANYAQLAGQLGRALIVPPRLKSVLGYNLSPFERADAQATELGLTGGDSNKRK